VAVEDAGTEPASDRVPDESHTATPPSLPPWAAFAFSDYRILWISSVSSLITMQLRMLVAGVWLYDETGSGVQLGMLGVVQLAVQLPGTLYGGALADQMDRKKLIALTQSFSFVVIALLAVLMATENLAPWHIYASTAFLGITSMLGNPARSALTANLVPRTHLMHAVTANTATFQIGAILAPLAFAGAVTRFGMTPTFALAAVFAVPAFVMPLLIRTQGVPMDRQDEGSMVRRIIEGFHYVRRHPILPGLYIMDMGVTIVSHYRLILPMIADKMFRAGAGAVGILNAANSFGGVIGTFAVLSLTRFRAKGMLVVYATLVYAVLLIAFGFNTWLWLGTIIIIGMGASDAIGMTTRQTTVQLTTSDNMRGRAVSFSSMSAMSANNLGTFEVGFMSEQIGAGPTMILGGVIGVVVVLAMWGLVRGMREYRYP
jgi:MFS family permease|tara:strand:+ start:1864 stop:3153 length:1290 start_codon:yes stop_codon:yes gene_type:complete